jgi:hypothetical protein
MFISKIDLKLCIKNMCNMMFTSIHLLVISIKNILKEIKSMLNEHWFNTMIATCTSLERSW